MYLSWLPTKFAVIPLNFVKFIILDFKKKFIVVISANNILKETAYDYICK